MASLQLSDIRPTGTSQPHVENDGQNTNEQEQRHDYEREIHGTVLLQQR